MVEIFSFGTHIAHMHTSYTGAGVPATHQLHDCSTFTYSNSMYMYIVYGFFSQLIEYVQNCFYPDHKETFVMLKRALYL